ncbi:type II toxin-antitoxin system VapC family toxin [Cecembia lonarensis]|uniref:PIN domain-containing protein n=1 Tax=Cecembia lonarensis (strain CCUG 58316 / KCTC 22772 / LW9) TaxID=1225176 RepID=K1LGZ0_CECL9|nr:PIN domain-containing protein [Cecembia lonarensis]EKB49558.1 hypothetical protein B879_01854 [Cecembia lonarensis LW9]
MPEVYLDTDVAFDIISKRSPYFETSVKLIDLFLKNKIELLFGECSLGNLFYLTFEIYKLEDSTKLLEDFTASCKIISGGKTALREALRSEFHDKEDALQYYTALNYGADYFITRNVKDYKKATENLQVLTPMEFLNSF